MFENYSFRFGAVRPPANRAGGEGIRNPVLP